MKLSDYVIKFLIQKGMRDIFMVSGGGIIHLVDSVGKSKAMNYYCNNNEQASGYCAEGWARQQNAVSACLVTTGPGSTNAVSGAASAWVDSVAMIFISGQVKRELIADYSRLRQIGEQEINIIDIVKPITKYAVTVNDPAMIRYELEKAFYKATTGRPGPVWISIPLDVQGSKIDEESLKPYIPAPQETKESTVKLKKQVTQVIKLLKNAKRPLLLCGYGIRLAHAEGLLPSVLEKMPLPVLLSFNGMDLLPEDHPNLVGKPGIIGQRRANFALQNADLLLTIGSRMNIKIVGYNYKDVASRAKKIMVDIDKEEMRKITVCPDLKIRADAKDFLEEFLRQIAHERIVVPQNWLDTCQGFKKRYPSITAGHLADRDHVNTYVFYDRLADALTSADVVVSGNGLAALNLYQAFKVKPQQRVFTNNGYGAMGWDLPAAIGACIAHNKQRTICVTGDGSIQMNIQELGLVGHHELPLKIFIFNNKGYTSIRLTQDNFFEGHYVGADEQSGVTNPDFLKIAEAYGLKYEKIDTHAELETKIRTVLSLKGPVLCEINVSEKQGIIPKTTSHRREDGSFASRPLEDMYPFLPREELKENMRISQGRKKNKNGKVFKHG